MKFLGIAFVGLLLVVSIGCVRQQVVPEHSPRVTTAQNSDGLVTLSWKSEVGYEYTIYVRKDSSSAWEPLKGARSFRGTGEVITITDKQKPRASLPWYSVRAAKR